MAFDPQAATAAYIDSLGPDALARAAAYTSGSHWLLLWGLLVSVLVTWVIVRLGVLERVDRRFAARGPALRTFVVGLVYFVVSSLLTLPWALYSDWWRESAYGRTSQPLRDWLAQGGVAMLISALLSAAFFVGVYALIRRAGRRWWLWSGGLTAVSLAAFMLAAPVFIEPLFNDYKPVPPGDVRDAVVVLAREAGVPPERIFVYDGSRQSNNFTANAAGVFGTARIAISDVAFKGATLDEVKAVTGHEIGHYVLGHVWRMVALLTLLAMLFFWLADRLFPAFARAFGSGATIGSPAGLPVLMVMASILALLGQPLLNAVIRQGENEADRYSLEHVGLPDALATALVKTAEYRDPRPSALQELLFYTHPSVEKRVLRAMQWKAVHATP